MRDEVTKRHSNDYEIWKASWFVVVLTVLVLVGAILAIIFTAHFHN